jgi:hypothetical protein
MFAGEGLYKAGDVMFLVLWTGANVVLTILLIITLRKARRMVEIMERAGNLQMDFLRDARVMMKEGAEIWAGKEEPWQESQQV